MRRGHSQRHEAGPQGAACIFVSQEPKNPPARLTRPNKYNRSAHEVGIKAAHLLLSWNSSIRYFMSARQAVSSSQQESGTSPPLLVPMLMAPRVGWEADADLPAGAKIGAAQGRQSRRSIMLRVQGTPLTCAQSIARGACWAACLLHAPGQWPKQYWGGEKRGWKAAYATPCCADGVL